MKKITEKKSGKKDENGKGKLDKVHHHERKHWGLGSPHVVQS